MSQVSRRLISMFTGIFLIIVSFILKGGIFRPILNFIGIILLTYSNACERSNKKLFLPLFGIIFFFFMVALDYLAVTTLKKEPIFAYSIVSTGNNKVYNAIGYRVWICDEKEKIFKVDPLYKLGYYCSTQDMTSESINNILPHIFEDSYIKITGRLTKIVNTTEIYMNTYKEDSDTYLYDDYILDVNFNVPSLEISKYNLNDDITIVGKVTSKTDNTIKIIDSNFVTIGSYETSETYNFDVNTNIYCQYDKELWFETKDKVFYKSCINNISLNIADGNYKLEAALNNGVITYEDIKNAAEGFLTNSKDKSVIYIFNNFKVLECDPTSSRDVIIGRTEMTFEDGYCKSYTEGVGV